MPGLFLVFEGVEGSGKSTQARLLADRLEDAGLQCILTREPGGTEQGEEIRRILLHRDELPAEAELLLMLAARSILVAQVIAPAIETGNVVIADRFDLSTLAYQGYGRGLPLERVRELNAFATGGLRPDAVLLLDVPVAEGARRRQAASSLDRIERAGGEFHERVGGAYRLLATSEPGIERIDAGGTIEEVHAAVVRRLEGLFPETFGSAKG